MSMFNHARLFLPILFLTALIPWSLTAQTKSLESVVPDYRIQLDTLTEGYDGVHCWAQARAAAIPREGRPPLMLVTMNQLTLSGSDIYGPIQTTWSQDLGKTWTAPIAQIDTLGPRAEVEGGVVIVSDFWPKWHRASGKVLGIGQTFRYTDGEAPRQDVSKQVVYASYDVATGKWSRWATLDAPEGVLAYQTAAGCAQRVDLSDGDILLPVYFKAKADTFYKVKVLRCRFDGERLKWVAEGNALRLDTKRGFQEPSLTRFGDTYYLSIRHDDASYVSTSKDGLNFTEPRAWQWDSGGSLGSYNTQAHWVTHSDKLHLVYTRRGANNDHVFRNRAPLFIAEVDTVNLVIKRATECVLIPEKGARYGNFGVCEVGPKETWIVETEWMQRPPEEPVISINNRWDAKARVYIARVLWERPNLNWDKR